MLNCCIDTAVVEEEKRERLFLQENRILLKKDIQSAFSNGIFDLLPGMVLLLDMNATILAFNGAMTTLKGLENLETGEQVYDFLPTNTLTSFNDFFVKVLTEGFAEWTLTQSAPQLSFGAKGDGVKQISYVFRGFLHKDKEIAAIYGTDQTSTVEEMVSLTGAAYTDPLTGLLNRRRFQMEVSKLSEHTYGDMYCYGLIGIDIDFFKKVNDTWGHAVGDEVLKHVAQTCRKNLRQADVMARFGGEEFFVYVLTEDPMQAVCIGEKLRMAIEMNPCECLDENGQPMTVPVTISIGVSIRQKARSDETLTTLCQRSDEALYEAKKNGRNKVVLCKEDAELCGLQTLRDGLGL